MLYFIFKVNENSNEMRFLPRCKLCQYACNHFDCNETPGEKNIWKLHKDALYYFKQILEATSTKQPLYGYLPSHLTNHQSKTN